MTKNVRNLTQIAIFTAVLCVFSPFTITLPISPVPISIINFIIYIFAVILGTKKALFGYFIYVLLGAVGLPVFSHWGSGFGYILGPTGGYILGLLFCCGATAIGMELGEKFFRGKVTRISIIALSMVIGSLWYYIFGTVWLAYLNNLDFYAAVAAGVLPFIPGDIFKIILAVILVAPLKERLKKFI